MFIIVAVGLALLIAVVVIIIIYKRVKCQNITKQDGLTWILFVEAKVESLSCLVLSCQGNQQKWIQTLWVFKVDLLNIYYILSLWTKCMLTWPLMHLFSKVTWARLSTKWINCNDKYTFIISFCWVIITKSRVMDAQRSQNVDLSDGIDVWECHFVF